eukprot:TRINITY_DN68969_c0_g1_i1.p1 TRINITY_DN68969_c0_g1~~TRINITY_DN68969_c0_g1_i1.p1  ORF type:complete len:370 (-),score=64.79 TRINITY_DN68969_c0_g1_i1:89-1198(-)
MTVPSPRSGAAAKSSPSDSKFDRDVFSFVPFPFALCRTTCCQEACEPKEDTWQTSAVDFVQAKQVLHDELKSDERDVPDEEPFEEREEVVLQSGKRYKGQWQGLRMHGHGHLLWQDGSQYEGRFEDGCAHGHGVLKKADGQHYDGQWKQDRQHGHGQYSDGLGSSYLGEWRDGLKELYGCEVWGDGSKYEGHFRSGKRHGAGCYKDPTGFILYKGEFKDDMMDGHGVYTWSAASYVGQWRGNLMNGEGTLTLPRGNQYRGQWRDGRRDGVGVLLDSRGLERKTLWISGVMLPDLEEADSQQPPQAAAAQPGIVEEAAGAEGFADQVLAEAAPHCGEDIPVQATAPSVKVEAAFEQKAQPQPADQTLRAV